MTLGWREGILVLAVVAAAYFAAMLARLLRMGRRRQEAALPQPPAIAVEATGRPMAASVAAPRATAAQAAMNAYAAASDEAVAIPAADAVSPAPTFAWEEAKQLFGTAPKTPAEVPAASREVGFGMPLAEHLAQDWDQAPSREAPRGATSDLEEELLRMRAEIERMRREMTELRAARRVSPQYAEAMELSQRGLRPQDVADRMNISLAEAELIQALGRGRQDFDEGESDER